MCPDTTWSPGQGPDILSAITHVLNVSFINSCRTAINSRRIVTIKVTILPWFIRSINCFPVQTYQQLISVCKQQTVTHDRKWYAASAFISSIYISYVTVHVLAHCIQPAIDLQQTTVISETCMYLRLLCEMDKWSWPTLFPLITTSMLLNKHHYTFYVSDFSFRH